MSRAGYYKWLKQFISARKRLRAQRVDQIRKIHAESRENFGAPRIYEQLRSNGDRITRRTVERLMKKHGIRAKSVRKFKATTDSSHDLPVAPNLLNRQFHNRLPHEVWVSDITYIDTAEGWLYLAVFIDLHSRSVIGWSMSSRMTAKLVLDAFRMGVSNAKQAPSMVHSDRGSQYASDLFRAELELRGCIQSMSRKGNCWDNAVAESFFGSLKRESVYHYRFATRDQAKSCIFDYVEVFYNRFRLHSALAYLTPLQKGQKVEKAA